MKNKKVVVKTRRTTKWAIEYEGPRKCLVAARLDRVLKHSITVQNFLDENLDDKQLSKK